MRRKVMVFSGGAYAGVEVCRALRDSLLFQPVPSSSYPDHSGFISEEYLENLPYTGDEDFTEKLNAVIDDNNIEFIIPTHDTIALTLAESADRLHAKVVCSPKETARLCRYKGLCYEALKGEFYMPAVYKSPAEIKDGDYPIIIKPDEGQGTRGVVRADNKQELERALEAEKAPVICEYLPGDEYTVDCFTNSKRELIFVNPRKRSRIMNGISARAECVEDAGEFTEIAEKVNSKLVFRGYWFIQLKRDKDGKLKLLELCTRFSGTFNHSQALGVNLPLLALCDFAGMDVSVVKNRYNVVSDKTYIDRFRIDYDYRRVYIDYDDTVTSKNGTEANPYVLAFLYQCRAKNKETVLITRHASSKDDSLSDNMKKLAISPLLFDRIVELEWTDRKTDFIDSEVPGIYIDNSFAERKIVAEKTGMPVFDVCHIDCLFDWR